MAFWDNTISVRLKEPAHKTTGKIIKPNATSYDIIWAAERSPPKNAYFELLDQPAKIIL